MKPKRSKQQQPDIRHHTTSFHCAGITKVFSDGTGETNGNAHNVGPATAFTETERAWQEEPASRIGDDSNH